MLIKDELKFTKYISLSLVIITVFILTAPVSDPVNVTKFLVLGILSLGSLGWNSYKKYVELWDTEKPILLSLIFFTLSSVIAVVFSAEPIVQNLYGLYGRNTGLLTYVFLAILLYATLSWKNSKSFSIYLFGFLAAGMLNILYGIWVSIFGDFIPWTNNYGALLGTFGNPDFAGAFLGMLSGVLLSVLFIAKHKWQRLLALILLFLNIFTVLETKTTQGILVFGISISASFSYFLYSKFSKFKIHKYFLLSFTLIAMLTLIGMFQKGPLADLVYKRSISLRGIYWDAALKTGNTHILTGVGMDGFGNWFRQVRSVKAATWFPGPGVVTNVAHNIYLDMYASGGLILLAAFTFFNFYAGWRLFELLKAKKEFDWIVASLTSIYFGYQAQAIISINQIGLGVWGWTIIGVICAYERLSREQNQKQKIMKINNRKTKQYSEDKSIVLVPIFMLLGLLLALPPFVADAKWTSALKFKDLRKLEESLRPSYFTPSSSERLANAVIILSQNNLDDQAYVYAKQGVKFSSNYFDAWNMLYYARKSTDSDRKIALENMKRLDPNNRTLDKLK